MASGARDASVADAAGGPFADQIDCCEGDGLRNMGTAVVPATVAGVTCAAETAIGGVDTSLALSVDMSAAGTDMAALPCLIKCRKRSMLAELSKNAGLRGEMV